MTLRIGYFIFEAANRISPGVRSKAEGQLEAWASAGHDGELFIPEPDATGPGARDFVQNMLAAWALAAPEVLSSLDIAYVRMGPYLPAHERIARSLPMVLEVNSDDLKEYRLRRAPWRIYNRVTRRRLHGLATGMIFPTREIAEADAFRNVRAERAIIANGINLARFRPLALPTTTDVRVAFVSGTPAEWTGVDRMLELAHALPDLTFDVVGPVPIAADAPPNVIFHGTVDETRLDAILAACTVGLGALAIDRRGQREACTLRVRRYLAGGLAVAIAHRDTDFEDQEFLLRLDLIEAPSEQAQALRAFAWRWRGRRVDPAAVAHLDVSAKEEARLAFFAASLGDVHR